MTPATTTVEGVMRTTSVAPGTTLDPESQELLQGLKSSGRAYDDACARLHTLLLRAARFEVSRRRRGLTGAEADALAMEAADDALLAVLRRLDDFRGLSKLTTWAYKFALYEAAVKVRRQTWRDREQQKFTEEFEATMQVMKRFVDSTNQHIPFLLRKAERLEEYLQQR